jgi:hypothetical protein
MATYRINVPTTGGTITAATFNTSCVDNVNIDFTSDPDQMIRSTGVTSDGKVTIDCYADNTPTSRNWKFPLTYKSGSNYCGHTLHLYQDGTTPSEYHMTLYIKNDSDYITDFTDITLTLKSNPVETITILNDLSGVPAHTTSQGIPYTAHTGGNRVQCVALVSNTKYSQEIKTLPCVDGSFCDPDDGDSATFKYDNNT